MILFPINIYHELLYYIALQKLRLYMNYNAPTLTRLSLSRTEFFNFLLEISYTCKHILVLTMTT